MLRLTGPYKIEISDRRSKDLVRLILVASLVDVAVLSEGAASGAVGASTVSEGE